MNYTLNDLNNCKEKLEDLANKCDISLSYFGEMSEIGISDLDLYCIGNPTNLRIFHNSFINIASTYKTILIHNPVYIDPSLIVHLNNVHTLNHRTAKMNPFCYIFWYLTLLRINLNSLNNHQLQLYYKNIYTSLQFFSPTESSVPSPSQVRMNKELLDIQALLSITNSSLEAFLEKITLKASTSYKAFIIPSIFIKSHKLHFVQSYLSYFYLIPKLFDSLEYLFLNSNETLNKDLDKYILSFYVLQDFYYNNSLPSPIMTPLPYSPNPIKKLIRQTTYKILSK